MVVKFEFQKNLNYHRILKYLNFYTKPNLKYLRWNILYKIHIILYHSDNVIEFENAWVIRKFRDIFYSCSM